MSCVLVAGRDDKAMGIISLDLGEIPYMSFLEQNRKKTVKNECVTFFYGMNCCFLPHELCT